MKQRRFQDDVFLFDRSGSVLKFVRLSATGHPGDWRIGAHGAIFVLPCRISARPQTLMRHTLAILALAAGGLTFAPPATAQETADVAAAAPTCASQGIQRVAVMVPPGQTTEQFQETLRTGGLFPAGTQVLILQPGQLMPLRNEAQFDARMRTTLGMFLDQGIIVQGTARMLVEVDEDGSVTTVHPNSGNADVNRLLVRTWRQARFEPYLFDGCRVKAWIQVPQTFSSDWSAERREVEVRSTPVPR
jgi:hypothetical protein